MEIQTNTTDRKQSSKTRVKVAIRVRPMLPREMIGDYRPCLEIKSEQDIVIGTDKSLIADKNNCRQYKYDRVFREDSPQNDVYEHCIKDLVLSCFEGYNAAVLAYGQTGSGKTYTMGTAVTSLSQPQRLGIIPRVINQIFNQVQQRKANTLITVTVSYIQLYNQQIVDLLVESQFKVKNESISIKEDKQSGLVNVEGVVKENVTTPEQMLRLLERGGTHRTTKHTNMNDVSSRSHAIFTIFIDSQPIKTDKKDEGISGITHSRFFFADLAGSQRAKKTGATGDTLKEGININLGLLQLGNVISALSNIDKNKDQFITFRNSKLTRILQDALGGNSNTYMIACVSPAESNYEQSLNTLKYALKAMNIKNTPVINRNKNDMLKQQNIDLKAENRRLKQMLAEKGVRIDFEQEKPDLMAMESKLLRDENRMLSRRYNEALVEIQKTKHKLNQLEIKIYDIRREKDLMQINFEQLMKDNPQLAEGQIALSLREKFEENEKDKLTMVQKYLQQIQHLEGKLMDRENTYSHLQSEYNTLLDKSKKDDKLLVKKQIMLYDIGRENNKLRQEIARLNLSNSNREETVLQDTNIIGQQTSNEELEMMLEEAEAIEHDDIIKEEQEDYCKRQQQTKDRLNQVDTYILQKQQFLQKISKQQMDMSTELISSMKNQYEQKIELLQKEKKQMMKQRDESGTVEKSKFINKIENLENQLKDYRKKAKEQRNMEKLVENQTSRIKDLNEEIKKFKMQKMELNRKLKQDKDNFQKLKSKRVKDLLNAKKENLKKQNDIRKEKLKNFKTEQTVKRKDQEIKRIKRVNQALKNIVKPTNRNLQFGKRDSSFLPQDANAQHLKQFDKQQEDLVLRIKKEYLIEIERQQSKTDMQMKLQNAQQELMILVNDDAANRIKLQRIELKDPEELSQQDQIEKSTLQFTIRTYEQDIKNLQIYITELQQAPEHTTFMEYFDIEAAIIYSKNYQSIDALRSFVKALNAAFKNLLYENCRMISQTKKDQAEIEGLKMEIFDCREKIMSLNSQMQRILSQTREDMMNRYYATQQPQPISAGLKRLDQKQKREMEKKLQDLTKNNRQLASQLEKTRRKCEIVQQKYQSIKNLVSKDKNIGRQQEPNFTKPEKKIDKLVSNKQILDQLDSMSETIDRFKKVKSFTVFQESSCEQINGSNEAESLNRWQCIWKQDAHTSGTLSIAIHSNFLISTATKSIKIWDLQSRKSIAELPAPAAVKYVMIDPDRRVFFTACQKSVTIWDLISLEVQGVMKCHKDEVKVINNYGEYIFTGGKGSHNGGSLLVWDLRKLNPNQALQEKEKNQDIFAFTSHQNILYYGTRNHSVRRMAVGSWDVLSPFQPPHLDSVTGLTVVGNRLISGSKDKHLRLWSLDHAVNNNKHTFYAFNDYVTTVQSYPNSPLFYAGSKDGQVKTCYLKNDRIEVLGGIMAHTQSINSMCILDENPFALMTASQDRMIKLWQPTKETLENIARQNYF